MNAELAISLIERNHFCREVWRDANSFSRRKDIEIAGLENQILIGILTMDFPELLSRIEIDPVQLNRRSIALRPGRQ